MDAPLTGFLAAQYCEPGDVRRRVARRAASRIVNDQTDNTQE
jgi:hypothetical protein